MDAHHATVTAAIAEGRADGHLNEVREAENNRDSGPRDSVIRALDEREGG